METKTINLRNVPDDLVRRAKAYAALRGLSLKELILDAVRQALDAAGPEISAMALYAPTRGTGRAKRKSRKRL